MHEIKMAIPSAIRIAMKSTGIAQSICHEYGRPNIAWIAKATTRVGKNLKMAITTAEIGNIILGNEVLRINLCPEVIAFTPPVKLFAMR